MPDLNEGSHPIENPDEFAPTRLITNPSAGRGATAEPLYANEGPQPDGVEPNANAALNADDNSATKTGSGIEGEKVLWEASYSMVNFLGRILFRLVVTVCFLVLAVEAWGRGQSNYSFFAIIVGILTVLLWVVLIYRMAMARYGHYYRLTNRRLFVSTGLMKRRRDQMELLRVKDVYTRQTFTERWLSLGTVIVISSEKEIPAFYITGVRDPKQVMDLVWSAARTERDVRSTNIHSV